MAHSNRLLVRRFAEEKRLTTSEDLTDIGLNPTPRQKKDVQRRSQCPGITFADAWSSSFVQDKYGAATTHWEKLQDRVDRGVGNPCPLLLVGLPSSIVTFGEPRAVVEALLEEAEESIETSLE